MRKKQQAAIALGLVISVVFLWFAFRDLHLQEVLDNLSNVNILLLLVSAGVLFLSILIITLRWQFLLKSITNVPLMSLFPLVCIGYMGNNVYPFRSGEALRIFLLRRSHGIPLVKGTTTVLIERIFDGIVMLTFIVIPLLITDISSREIQQVMTFATPIFVIALLVFFGLAFQPDLLRLFLRIVSQVLPQRMKGLVENIGEDIIDGLKGLRTPLDLAGAIITSYLTWMIQACVYWIVAFAFDMDVSYAVMLLTVGAVNLAGLLPASPGQIGVFEFFASLVLVSAGVNEAQAATYALVLHVVVWLPVTLAGFGFLIRQGLGWDAIAHAREIEEQAAVSS